MITSAAARGARLSRATLSGRSREIAILPQSPMGRVLKLVAFALLPTVLLLGAGEIVARMLALDAPRIASGPLYEEQAGITRADPELFWSVRPNLDGYFRGARLTTNSIGLRGAEIEDDGAYRILFLGESTTFGFGVADDETYAARVERMLNAHEHGRKVRAINAGVTAYTSFQSLVYLKTRGLALEPDAVVLYHWANDFLPTTYRDSRHSEIGVSRSDPELYRFYKSLYVDQLVRHSALFRAGMNAFARHAVASFRSQHAAHPEADPVQLAWSPEFFPHEQKVRVPPPERRRVLAQFLELSRTHGFDLVVIHPTYRDVDAHDDLLLEFCRTHDVPIVDAPAVFARSGVDREALFSDSMHPTVLGHALLAGAVGGYFARQLAVEEDGAVPRAADGNPAGRG